MAAILFFGLIIFSHGSTNPAEGQLITSPPKLEVESNRVVWYQIPSGAPNKFELKCQASGDSIKYEWLKNGQSFKIDNERVVWQRSGQAGTIVFLKPDVIDQGFYQCRASNIFGVALSNIFEVKLGALDHFSNRPIRDVKAKLGEPLTLPCYSPYGVPNPSIFWLFRNTKQSFVIETIDRPHITVDGEGNLRFAYVEMHDGRENLVYQCAATSPVLHGEYRAGDEIRLIVENASMIERRPKPMWFSPNNIKITAGETLKLMCIFSGYPVPVVEWSKKSESLPVKRIEHENFGKTLVIKHVLHKDRGIYVCQAGNTKHTMRVEVSSAPQWIEGPPKNFNASEEGEVELKCLTHGEPEPTVQWFKNGVPLNQLDFDDRIQISPNSKKLKIIRLQHKIDRAVYQCNVSNSLGYIFANAYVNVKAHAPTFLSPINQTLKSVVGSSVDLDCNADGAPRPEVRWVDLDNKEIVINGEKRQVLDNGTLRIQNLRIHDADTYFCDVVNKFGINQARRVLEVYRPSYFNLLLEPSERTVKAGDSLDLMCLAESDERLKIVYVWTKDGRPINNFRDSSFQQQPGRTTSSERNRLKLSNVLGRDTGIYKCTVKTDVDEISTQTKLIVKDAPEAPIITNIRCGETQALINWTASFDNNDKIKEYFVEYEIEFYPGMWKSGLVEKSKDSKVFYEAAVNLSPCMTYAFRVSAANSFGRGLPGYMHHVKCKTPPSVPYENPANVTVYGTTKDNLIITWQPLKKESWNAPNLTYLIRYRMKNSIENNWHNLVIKDPEQNMIELDGVPTFKLFEIQVRSKNAQGLSIKEPATASGYSGEDVPSTYPQNFKVIELSATKAKFSWDPVDKSLLHGLLTGYIIKIWPITQYKRKRLAGFIWEVQVQPDKVSEVVNGLKPMHAYAAHIVVCNSKFNSTPSEIVKFTTPEGPPGPVDNMIAQVYGAQTILTTWSPPTFSLGNLSAYRIEYYEENFESEKRNIYETIVGADLNHHLLNTLKPETNYTVVVWALTGAGPGPALNYTVRTFARQKPGQPDLDIQSFDSNSVAIKWIMSKTGLPGSSFHVNYSAQKSTGDFWMKSQSVQLPDSYITVHNLIPEVEYKFVLYAEDNDLSTPSIVKRFRTINKSSLLYTGPTEDSNMTGAVWLIAVMSVLCTCVLTLLAIFVFKTNKGGKYSVKKKELERGNNVDNDEEKSFMEYQYGTSSGSSTTGSNRTASVDASSLRDQA